MERLAGWGNYPKSPSELLTPHVPDATRDYFVNRSGIIARGAGRAYGDAAIGSQYTVSTLGFNRMQRFDRTNRRLTVEAGVTIADILATVVPEGFFLKVVPGTKYVTVGGAIAADVHGKNHHRDGGFGDTVDSLRLLMPSGDLLTCSRAENDELFLATVGGMGLTGVILDATIRLLPIETAWLSQKTLVGHNLDEALDQLEASKSAAYSVAWVDCLARGSSLGRSLVYVAEHAARLDISNTEREMFPVKHRTRLSVPAFAPPWLLNRTSMRAFNELYFRRGMTLERRTQLIDWDSYFFPLDAINNWNRVYGRKGFLQYQCVVPIDQARAVLGEILSRVSHRGDASFLAVLKRLGNGGGLMSFPLLGYTLAMDFPVTSEIFRFLDELDELVVNAGGRLYLAKDARQSRNTFVSGYPGLDQLRTIRKQIGADIRLSSHLSERLGV
jgi:decaprenylphospho-beta-D-ribofuranose 2-oxidase